MKRDEAKTNLIALGIEEPTKEQIDSYLNSFQGDIQKEKDNALKFKENSDKYEATQKELELEKAKTLTADEKLQAAIDAANLEKSGFTRATNKLAVEKILVGAGLKETDYADLIDGLVSEDSEKSTKLATSLSAMIANQKTTTEANVKEQMLKGNPLPPGNGGAGTPPAITEAEQIASSIAKSSVSTEQTNSIIENYK